MKSHVLKLLLLLLLLAVFYEFGGFHYPRFDDYPGRQRRRLESSWNCCVALYCAGAITALWGRRTIGDLHPVSLRALYVAAGIAAMAGALLYMNSLKWVDSPRPRMPSKITGPNAGRPRQLPIRTSLGARTGQFCHLVGIAP